AGAILLRGYARDTLHLAAQQASYSVEAAVLFDDAAATMDALGPIGATKGVAEIRVLRADGRLMAQWQADKAQPPGLLAQWLCPGPASARIGPAAQPIGQVQVRGNADGLAQFITISLLGAVACLLLALTGAALVARRLRRTIVQPLRAMADVAHDVRAARAFSRRAPGSRISEVDDMARDFNALLDELQNWQGQMDSVHQALLHRAGYDPLSGLPNREAFIERVGETLRGAARTGNRFAILFMDGDGFKQTNDRFGHAAGDKVIVDIAARISPLLRAGDMAARLGGDEFGVLVHHIDATDDAQTVADRITAAMLKPFAVDERHQVAVGLSIGVAIAPDDGTRADQLLQVADRRMYEAKLAKKAP
ncbi:MAG: diguanylate cyclase domain-containing protein, partial [Sphingopyxis sp.]